MIKKIIYISILFGLISFQGLCNNTIDTLELQIQSAKDSNRVKILCDLCWEYRFVSAEQALKFGNEALELANQLGFKKANR